MTETGVFSIITTYLRLAKEGRRIRPHRVDGATWIDVGKPESLEEARALFERRS
jgi:NDP-sugar pyrophosphorylase family protein